MDFIRLAVRDVRKNSSRTGLAIAATALATVILVLSRLVPQGYMRYQTYAERSFADADVLVWSAPQHVYSKDTSSLEWRAWTGEVWQSFAEYFMPELKSKGYVSMVGAPPWGPLDTDSLLLLISRVDGVLEVSPYLSFPCRVKVDDGYVDAILRGREFAGPSRPLSMEWQVKRGRPLGLQDEGLSKALVPLISEPVIPYGPQMEMEILIPRPLAGVPGANAPSDQSAALSWDNPTSVRLDVVGAYKVELGVVPLEHLDQQTPTGYWKRPEILVSRKTFLDLVGRILPEPPVYQMLVKVARHSDTKVVVQRLREALGQDYGVYAVAELVSTAGEAGGLRLIVPDMSSLIRWMIITMAAGIVAASVYVLLALQTRKIGLLRAIGATSKDIVLYALSAVAYTTLAGIGIGFVLGKLISLTVITATDFSFLEWLKMAGYDALLSLAGIAIPLVLGLGVAIWASRIPCAEVLRRE